MSRKPEGRPIPNSVHQQSFEALRNARAKIRVKQHTSDNIPSWMTQEYPWTPFVTEENVLDALEQQKNYFARTRRSIINPSVKLSKNEEPDITAPLLRQLVDHVACGVGFLGWFEHALQTNHTTKELADAFDLGMRRSGAFKIKKT